MGRNAHRWRHCWPALLAASSLLAGCGARLVPPGDAGRRPAGTVSAGVYTPHRLSPVRQPVAAVPIAPVPAFAMPAATSAAGTGLAAGPVIGTLPIAPGAAGAALASFRAGCLSLVRRQDASGLTRPADWQPACDAAARTGTGGGVDFFRRWFEAVQVGDGRAFATGYYVPEIAASRERRAGYDVPIYARPDDLIDVDLGRFSEALKGRKIRGRVNGTALLPYYDRSQIEAGAIGDHARVLAWAADQVAFFFLQVQGSGVLRLAGGGVMRIGYDTQNGRDYTGIGALMKTRGLLGPGQSSMQGIVAWLHDHPDEGRRIMDENRSFVFFREMSGDPVGSLGLPVVGGTSAAVDPRFVPMGAPVFLSMDRTDATGLWIAQDTGGAIKGANRFDTFWGSGDPSAAVAGGMSAHGTAFVLLPLGTLSRVAAAAAGTGIGGSGANAGSPPR